MKARHPVAAVCAVLGVVLGAVATVGVAASGADGEVSGTTVFTCTVGTFAPYEYDATIQLQATRASAADTTVAVTATISDMPGVIPVSLGKTAVTDELVLNLGGKSVKLKGAGSTTIVAKEPLVMPDLSGTMTTDASSLSTTVTSFAFSMPAFSMGGTCTPTSGADLGTLTIATNSTASPTATDTSSPSSTPTATATATATATDSASPTATESASAEGVPAKGDVAFACTLSLGTPFDYDATISVSGYREEEGGPVKLIAKMSDLPGIAPVPINGEMAITLDAEVGGTAVTLKGSGNATAPTKGDVPVSPLKGEVDVDGDELEVAVSAFTFEFAALTISADCTSDRTVLSALKVGTKAPVETDDPDPSSSPTDTATTPTDTDGTGSGSLPKTGGADSMPVIVLWAAALSLLGIAGLVSVPAVARRRHH